MANRKDELIVDWLPNAASYGQNLQVSKFKVVQEGETITLYRFT